MDCIPKHIVNKFKAALKSGEVTPEMLLDMDSAQRTGYFSTVFGMPNASKINALFESKMLLKAQQQGIVNWANKIVSPDAKKDIISRVNKMNKVLSPASQDAFLADLAAQKLGMSVSMKEASDIMTLAKDVAEKEKAVGKTEIGSKERLDYGHAMVEFQDYYGNLKNEAKKKKLSEWALPTNWGEGFTNLAGFFKSLKASFDNSVIGRQGIKTLFNQPDIWLKNSAQSFKDFWVSATGGDAMKAVRAEVMSRPNAINGLYKKHKLAVGVTEESFPTSIPERIPVLGKIFKGSQDAFTAWQYRTRADVFDRLVEVAEKTGADIEGLGQFVNSLTGRGDLGKLERAATVTNNIFFSPRFLKSNLDTLTAGILNKGQSKFVREQAAWASIRTIGGVALILAIAKGYDDESVEFDPRSSDFGKIRVGNTRFDVSGGMASIVTLASRLITKSSKSAATGIVTDLNKDKFGSRTTGDVMLAFLAGKMSPFARVLTDIANDRDFKGQKPTPASVLNALMTPIPVENMFELAKDKDSAPFLATIILDSLGIGSNTYGVEIDLNVSPSDKIKAFKARIGDDKFKKANEKLNEEYSAWFKRVNLDTRYMRLSDDDKAKVLSKKKTELKDKMFDRYGFRYKTEKKDLPKIR
jgi:hypothetical protein